MTTNADNLISRRMFEGKKLFSRDGVSLSILIDHHTSKHTSDDRGHRTQPYMEICATNDYHHLSRLVVSARKVFRKIGASEDDHRKTMPATKAMSKGGIMNEAEDDVHKQKLLESSDFAKDLAASYLYNRLSIVLDTNDTTKFSIVLSPLASDMINGNTRLDLELEYHSENNHGMVGDTHDIYGNNVAYALHKPDSLYNHRRPSSPPIKRQTSNMGNSNSTQSTLIPSHLTKQKDKNKYKCSGKDEDKEQGLDKDKGNKQKVHVRDYPFHQFTKWKEGTLPSTPRRGVNHHHHHHQSNQSDEQFHLALCVALNGYVTHTPLHPITHNIPDISLHKLNNYCQSPPQTPLLLSWVLSDIHPLYFPMPCIPPADLQQLMH